MAKGYLSGIVTGAVLGAVAALLLAPKKGEELRNDLSDAPDKFKDKGETLKSAVTDAAADLKARGAELLSSAKDKGAQLKDEAGHHLEGAKTTVAATVNEVKGGDLPDDAKEKLDEARLQAHLAAMEADEKSQEQV